MTVTQFVILVAGWLVVYGQFLYIMVLRRKLRRLWAAKYKGQPNTIAEWQAVYGGGDEDVYG